MDISGLYLRSYKFTPSITQQSACFDQVVCAAHSQMSWTRVHFRSTTNKWSQRCSPLIILGVRSSTRIHLHGESMSTYLAVCLLIVLTLRHIDASSWHREACKTARKKGGPWAAHSRTVSSNYLLDIRKASVPSTVMISQFLTRVPSG